MNKVLELLEQHCQWLAVGLGGVFLAIVAWTYVAQSPVAHTVGQKTLTPGDVDTEVNKEITASLERRISEQTVPTIRSATFDPRSSWIPVMEDTGKTAVAVANPWSSIAIPIPEHKGPNTPQEREVVSALPVVPSAEVPPQQALKVARVFAAPVVAVGAAGGPPPAPGNPGAAGIPAGAKDINYVRGEYRIDPAAIGAEWQKVKVPMGMTTSILAVKVVRQERLPGGKWSEPKEISLIQNGVTLQAIPPENDQQAALAILGWSESPQGQADLLRPPFFQVIQGEGPWDAPMEFNLKDPETLKAERLEKAKQDYAERQRQKAEQQKNRPATPTAPPEEERRPRRSGRAGREPGMLANDPARPSNLADLAGLQLAQVPDPAMVPGMDGVGMEPPVPGQPAGAGQANHGPLPSAKFDPRQAQPIFGWFYDDTVVEGHTYRYQVLYAIKNPMHLDNRVANPALARVLALWSKVDENAWSEERTVETSTHYYLANSNWQAGNVPGTVRVEVYKWTAGKWQVRVFTVALGDAIGAKEMGVDFGTASMLVDLRYDDRTGRAYAVILGPDGRMTEREPISDRDNQLRQILNGIIKGGMAPIPGAPPAGVNAGGAGAPVANR